MVHYSKPIGTRPGKWLAWLYGRLRCERRWRLGGILMNLVLRVERGQMHSGTARRLLAQHHDIEVGLYSYGPCFKPGWFPPSIRIGRYTSIASGVRIVNENHPLNSFTTHAFFYNEGTNRRHLAIGNDVWIGFNAIILPGCQHIGDGAVIGAGAVVTRDVPPYAIVGGNPARVIRYRFDEETRTRLVTSRWWDMPPDEASAAVQALHLDVNVGSVTPTLTTCSVRRSESQQKQKL